jgi:hypothetical protein
MLTKIAPGVRFAISTRLPRVTKSSLVLVSITRKPRERKILAMLERTDLGGTGKPQNAD